MWKTLSYEVQGRGHHKSKKVCQDKTYTYKKDNYVAIALADGAGSASHSDVGAEIACKSICEYVGEHFDRLIKSTDAYAVKKEIIDYILGNLKQKALDLKCSIDGLASTLLFVGVKDNLLMVLHVGDGVIGYLKNNMLLTLSQPNNGEFANATYFVTSKGAYEQTRIFKGNKKGISGFVLLSDGSSSSLYDKRANCLAPLARRILLWSQFIYVDKLLPVVKDVFNSAIIKRTMDDCSIALMVDNLVTDEQFLLMDKKEKCQLFDRGITIQPQFLQERYDILKFITTPKTIKEVAKMLDLSERKASYRLKHLIKLGMVSYEKGYYKSDIC